MQWFVRSHHELHREGSVQLGQIVVERLAALERQADGGGDALPLEVQDRLGVIVGHQRGVQLKSARIGQLVMADVTLATAHEDTS